MLPRSRRLNRNLFDRVRASRLVVRSRSASLRFLPSNSKSRFSVVIPKSLAGTAATRNNIRRRIYETVRPLRPAFDGIIYLAQLSGGKKALAEEIRVLLAQAARTLSNLK